MRIFLQKRYDPGTRSSLIALVSEQTSPSCGLGLFAEDGFEGGFGELLGRASAADADGARNLAFDDDGHAAGAREVADPDRGLIALAVDVLFQTRGCALPMR